MEVMDISALGKTSFNFPGQTAVYSGKVRDVYTVGERLVSVATDRISAFDVILPRPIPYKGQVLNQLAEYFLNSTNDIARNWLEAVPDPNVSVGIKADPLKVEMVVRGMLVGHAYREYSSGKRELCGQKMVEGLNEYDLFPEPIITPTTKASEGHDEDISPENVIKQGIVDQDTWDQITDYSLKLFARGQKMANERGLVLADTKYEFGIHEGKVILIDEVHTPDSSRYFYKDSYETYLRNRSLTKPKHLSKEFVREWLMENGFNGGEGQLVPEMTDEVVNAISERYIELYEAMTGNKFAKDDYSNIEQRILDNVINYLKG